MHPADRITEQVTDDDAPGAAQDATPEAEVAATSSTTGACAAVDVPHRQCALPGRARLQGWLVTVETGRIEGRNPQRPHEPAWQLRWDDHGVVARCARPRSAAGVRRLVAGKPDPVRLVRATLTELDTVIRDLSLPGRDASCVCCGITAPPQAGLLLSYVGLCWSCHQRHSELADYDDLAALPPSPLRGRAARARRPRHRALPGPE